MKKSSLFRRRSAWLCSVSAALLLSASAGIAEDRIKRFHIPGQSLDAALVQFSEQSDVIIVAPQGLIEGKLAPEIRGDMRPEQALRKLLEGSGLNYSRNKDGAITIRLAATSGAAQRQGATALAMLQEQTTDQGRDQAAGQDRDTSQQQQEDELLEIEEIVITGTHIRGVGLSVGSRVDVIDRLEIDRSGFATTHQVLESLPQNFRGGVNEDTFGRSQASNATSATSVNLRGLANDSTLVLINGRRVPVAGSNANFFDVSAIPTTAIDRIEVLSDGASAIYGSDAIAGVVNIILRDDYEGAETRLRFGTVTEGGQQEYQFGQVFGANWDTGNALISYEYYKREALANAERAFAADSDLRPFGGDNQGTEFSNPGNILSPFTFTPAFAIPPGQDGTALTAGDLLPIPPAMPNLSNVNLGKDLMADQERHGIFATFRQRLNEKIEFFAEGRFSKRDFSQQFGGFATTIIVPSSNAFFVDPFGFFPTAFLNYNFLDDLGSIINEGDVKSYNAVVGSTVDLGNSWEVTAYGSYSKDDRTFIQKNIPDFVALAAALADPDPATAFNPFGDGSNTSPATIEAVRVAPTERLIKSEVWVGNIVADGTIFPLPGGEVKLAVGLDYRQEKFTIFEREVFAAFGELYIPLFGEGNRISGFENLILSVAARYEDYDDIGSTTNPKLGLVWTPVEGLNLRATWGESFKAPNLTDLDETDNSIAAFSLSDPMSPFGTTFSLLLQGQNSALKNETATTWTLGADFSPTSLPGFNAAVTYFNIDFKDRITNPGNPLIVLEEEDIFSSIITRDPDPDQVEALCNDPTFSGDPAICSFIPIGAIVDLRLNNTAKTKVEGIDFTLSYGFDLANAGRLDLRLNGSYLFKFDEAFSEIAPVTELIDTVNNPVDFTMRNSLTWSNNRGLSTTLFVNYTDSYKDDESDPERGIESWTTFDLTARYDTGDRLAGAGLNDTTFTLSVLNLFDNDPPFVNNLLGVGYDPANATPLGRFISFNITKKW